MATRKGFDFATAAGDAPPPDKMGADDEVDDADDSAGLVSAVHDLAKAFGVQVKDESRAVQAVRDICRLSGGEETDDSAE